MDDSGCTTPRPAGPAPPREYYWLWVMCLLGLDYFSTLAYQPSITVEVAGRLGPLATAVVILVTLAGALPVYCYLAGRSPRGEGSIGLLERLVRGWKGKTLVLVLLGFAATDFTMLKTISLADAAQHLIRSDDAEWQRNLKELTAYLRARTEPLSPGISRLFDEQMTVTLLLGALGFLFWFLLRKGFNRNVLILAVPLVSAYLVLNGLLLAGGIRCLTEQPYLVENWLSQVHEGDWLVHRPFWAGSDWLSVALLSLLFLPNLALGLSGFELSMIIMPRVKGKEGEEPPRTRIRNTRKVLIVAALIMAVYLLASSLVTGLLIPFEEFQQNGKAVNRALAYLAHGGMLTVGQEPILPWCGNLFGTVYDLVTVMLLCLAGTSVMTALAALLPQFLSRFGMELKRAQRWGVLLMVFAGINLVVTLYFQASVSAQRNAYASGVLVLMSGAAVVVVLEKKRSRDSEPVSQGKTRGLSFGHFVDFLSSFWRRLGIAYFTVVAAVFVLTTIAVAVHSASGLVIAVCFIVALLVMSIVSRAYRAGEMRTIGFEFTDPQSKFLWDSLRSADFPVLVPHRPGHRECETKEEHIRKNHQLAPDTDIVFLEVEVDDPSNFFQNLLVKVVPEERRFIIKLTRCVSVAHAIAAVALEMSKESRPPGLHFGWPEMGVLAASWSYLAFGEGNIPWKVRELIHLAEPNPERRPRVIVG
jgi:hypothetical protein